MAVDKTAAAFVDAVDVLVVGRNNQVLYSAKNAESAAGTLEFVKADSEKKYLISAARPDAVFRFIKGEKFMLNAIMNQDFGKIRSDYDDDSIFESELTQKSIYMLSRVGVCDGGGTCDAFLLRIMGADCFVDVSECGKKNHISSRNKLTVECLRSIFPTFRAFLRVRG